MISVIIPTCNRHEQLRYCLLSLSPQVQLIDQDMYEVIVSDDGENIAQGFIEKEFPFVKWIKGPKAGPAANRNNGASVATGEWLVFVDDDCMAYNNLIHTYIHTYTAADDSIGAFEGAVVGTELRTRYDQYAPINIDGGNFWSANISIRRSLFERIGGFDEAFVIPFLEDDDIYIRLLKETHVPFLRNAVVMHPWKVGSVQYQLPAIIKAHQYFFKKHQLNTLTHRLERIFIFYKEFARNTYHLLKYGFKGSAAYPHRILLYWKIIFV